MTTTSASPNAVHTSESQPCQRRSAGPWPDGRAGPAICHDQSGVATAAACSRSGDTSRPPDPQSASTPRPGDPRTGGRPHRPPWCSALLSGPTRWPHRVSRPRIRSVPPSPARWPQRQPLHVQSRQPLPRRLLELPIVVAGRSDRRSPIAALVVAVTQGQCQPPGGQAVEAQPRGRPLHQVVEHGHKQSERDDGETPPALGRAHETTPYTRRLT